MAVFFTQEYRIGPKDLAQAIPTLVLVGIITRAVLVLRNCILGALDEQRRTAITRNWLFRLGLDWPLRMAHWMAWLWRREPVWLPVSQGAALAVSVVTLILTAMGRHSLLWDNSGIIARNGLLLVLLPIAVLVLQFKMTWERPWVRAVTLGAIIAAFGAAAYRWDMISQSLPLQTLAQAVAAGLEAFHKAL